MVFEPTLATALHNKSTGVSIEGSKRLFSWPRAAVMPRLPSEIIHVVYAQEFFHDRAYKGGQATLMRYGKDFYRSIRSLRGKKNG